MSKYDEIPIDVSRTDQILRFVRSNPNCTKTSVIRHMKGRSSINTTHYILLNLIDKGKLNVNRVTTQTHLLTINEEDDFNIFYKILVDIEDLIEEMSEFISSNDIDKNPEIKKLFVGLDGIENSYRELVSTMLTMIYFPIIASPGSFGEFYKILFNQLDVIYSKYAYARWDKKTTDEVLAISSKNLEVGFKAYNNQVKVKTNIGDRLMEALEDFRNKVFDIYNF